MSPRHRAREWLVLNARPASDLLIVNIEGLPDATTFRYDGVR